MALLRTKQAIIGDAVGLAHCIVANLVVVAGYFVEFYPPGVDQFDGLRFVYDYLDRPVFFFFINFVSQFEKDAFLFPILIGEFVIIMSSLLYGVIAYIFAKLLFPGDR